MVRHAEFECNNCGNNAHCHLTVEMMEKEDINEMFKCKLFSNFVPKVPSPKKVFRCCGCEKEKSFAMALEFLKACEQRETHIFISGDYVVIPRATWEELQRVIARHRIVSIDEAIIINQGDKNA